METTTDARGRTSSTLVVAVVAVLVAIAALALAVLGGGDGGGSEANLAADLVAAIDEDAYQAVTLTSGTVYYGKLSNDGAALLLDDVYYLGGATEDNPSGSLIKRGAEIYAPEGPMVLNPALVVQIDEIGNDSVIARGIDRIKSVSGTATTTTTTGKPTTTTTTAAPTTTTAAP